MFKYAVLLAVLGCAWAAPKEDAAAAQPIQLSEFIANAEKTLTGLATNIKDQLNLPDQETVVSTIKTQGTTLADNFKSYFSQASEQFKDKTPEIQGLWTDMVNKVNKALEDINANVPNAKESAAQLQKQFEETVQIVVKESNKLAEAVKQNSGTIKEDIASYTKKAVDLAVDATHNLNEQLKNAANQAEKKN